MASGVGFDLPPVRPIFEKYISEKGLAERRDSSASRSLPSSAELILRVNSDRTSGNDFSNIAINSHAQRTCFCSQLTQHLVVGRHVTVLLCIGMRL